jgi:hypothetical protein
MARESYPTCSRTPPPTRMPPFEIFGMDPEERLRHLVEYIPNLLAYIQRMVDVLNSVRAGKLNCVTDVTLTASATTTTLTDARIGPNSFIGFMPRTATAATALAGLYVSARTKGSATLTHANTADTDKTFTLCVIG